MSIAPDLHLLTELRAAGLRLAPLDDGRVHVGPPERITPEIRARIVSRKPALLAALAFELELAERIRAMGARWQYCADDLAEAMTLAHADPVTWLQMVAADEQHAARAARAGCPWPPASFAPCDAAGGRA